MADGLNLGWSEHDSAELAAGALGTPEKIRVVTAAELLGMKLPQRAYALEPILPQPGLAMLFGPRGMGKTYVALSIAHAMASGGTGLKWRAPGPRRVLYCDGEMPASMMQERLAQIAAGAGHQPPEDDFLRFACADLDPDHGLPNLNRSDARTMVEDALGDGEVLILDNLSTLATGMRENEADDWGEMQAWLLGLRRRGKHVLLIHHAGKGGQQRGTSRREDALDTVIALRRPADYETEQGARLEVHLEKARGIAGPDAAPFEAALVTRDDGGLEWSVRDLADTKRELARSLIQAGGQSVRQIAEETGLSKSAVQRLKDSVDGGGRG
jgi:putative DNA primase/helicase